MIETAPWQPVFLGNVMLPCCTMSVLMREVREGDAVYYLDEARIKGNQILTFAIPVSPKGVGKPIRAVFEPEFFVQ